MAKGKVLYAVLWVDDAGSLPLRRQDVAWYHRNAGPLSFAWEKDERYPWSSIETITKSSADFSFDYLSHHLHPVTWKGATVLKRIYDHFKLFWRVHSFLRLLQALRIPPRMNRALYAFAALAYLALIFFSYEINKPLFAFLVFFFLALMGLAGIWRYVRRGRNWTYTYHDSAWLKHFLPKMREHFADIGHQYPQVVRHGWNLPPASTMEFYLAEMGVLADFSATPTPGENRQQIGGRGITWRHRQPYYASLHGDYDTPWDRDNETDRGILEIPVTLGNLPYYGFGQPEKKSIAETPPGGLVSAYIHPWDEFSLIKDWVDYLQQNYDVQFVRADEYVNIFMKKQPRPAMIDRNISLKWAFLRAERFGAIREIDKEIASLQVLSQEGSSLELLLKINTESPIPLLWVEARELILKEGKLDYDVSDTGFILKSVAPGVYRFSVVPLGPSERRIP